MDCDDIKRKLRDLKKFELYARSISPEEATRKKLVWDQFFSTKDENSKSVRFSIAKLCKMSHEQRKEAFDEYYYYVYYKLFEESGLHYAGAYDPSLLAFLGLPPDAEEESIKKRFRELAKKYHPDHGGDKDKMIELIDAYDKLLKK